MTDTTVANSPQAAKRAKQAEVRRQRNMSQRSRFRTSIKAVLSAIKDGNKDAATQAMQTCESLLDRYAGRGLLHKNKAARHKSRLRAKIKALS